MAGTINNKNKFMKQLQLEDSEARSMYLTASSEIKKILENSFSKAFFSVNIMDRIKTYEDACAELGREPLVEKEMKRLGFTDVEIARRKIGIINEALNEGWEADYSDSNQNKWRVWIKWVSGGFVFGVTYCDGASAVAGDGSRLCLKSEELAKYSWNQFSELYKIITIDK